MNGFGHDRRVQVLVVPTGFAVVGMGLLKETRVEFDYSKDPLELTYTGWRLFDPHRRER